MGTDIAETAEPASEDYRPLLERLETLAFHLPISHTIGHLHAGKLLAALVHYVEFGPELLDAADADAAHTEAMVSKEIGQRTVPLSVPNVLMGPYPDLEANAQQAAADQSARLAELENLVAQLQEQRLPTTTAAGTEMPRTTVTTEPVDTVGATELPVEPPSSIEPAPSPIEPSSPEQKGS